MVNLNSLPNLLSLFRILATPLLVWLILVDNASGYFWAVVLLIVMALSDFFDGRIARKLQVTSKLGIYIDTISDKIFVASALLAMIECGLLSAWIGVVIIGREFIISGLRAYAASEGIVIAAGMWGKQKFAITVVALAWQLLAAMASSAGILVAWDGGPAGLLLQMWVIAMAAAVIWTIMSAIDYLWKARTLLRRGWHPVPVQPE